MTLLWLASHVGLQICCGQKIATACVEMHIFDYVSYWLRYAWVSAGAEAACTSLVPISVSQHVKIGAEIMC
jgi:hypothetical protein